MDSVVNVLESIDKANGYDLIGNYFKDLQLLKNMQINQENYDEDQTFGKDNPLLQNSIYDV